MCHSTIFPKVKMSRGYKTLKSSKIERTSRFPSFPFLFRERRTFASVWREENDTSQEGKLAPLLRAILRDPAESIYRDSSAQCPFFTISFFRQTCPWRESGGVLSRGSPTCGKPCLRSEKI